MLAPLLALCFNASCIRVAVISGNVAPPFIACCAMLSVSFCAMRVDTRTALLMSFIGFAAPSIS